MGKRVLCEYGGLDEAKVREYIQEQEESDLIEDKYDSDLSNPF